MVNIMQFQHLQAVVFDWAGTVIDFGSQAPMAAFVELFARHGVAISIDEARVPMGLPKWEHIQALGQQPRIAAAWQEAKGAPFTDDDVDALYAEFTPMNMASVQHHARLIGGTSELVQMLRERGLRIGSTTGYNREIMQVLAPLAAAQGFVPDNLVCAGDLPQSRPSPMGMIQTFKDLGVTQAEASVKVDDTVPGLLEGRSAGCWTVAVMASGNALGLTEEQWRAMDEPAREVAREQARQSLGDAQPDFWIDSISSLLPVLRDIDLRLDLGQHPSGALLAEAR